MMMAGTEGKLKLLQALVLDQWKTGAAAELRVCCESGHMKVSMSADFGPSSLSWRADSVSLGGSGSPSRQRRRQRRAAARSAAEMAATAEKSEVSAAAEKAVAENAAAEKAAAEKAAVETLTAGKVSAGKTAAEKVAAASVTTNSEEVAAENAATVALRTNDAEKQAIVVENECVASTSCNGKQLPESTPASTLMLKSKVAGPSAPIILNWAGAVTSDHQCDTLSVSPSIPTPVLRCEETPPSAHLPLCHYCCHLGSGLNPVHYYLQCLCSDKVCTCKCYCSEQQLEHKKQFFPGGFSTNCVDVNDRPRARVVAEERANKLDYKGTPMAQRPCEAETCIKM